MRNASGPSSAVPYDQQMLILISSAEVKHRIRNVKGIGRFLGLRKSESSMYAHHFPVTRYHPVLCNAMEIAMAYMRARGLAERFINPASLVASGINDACHRGVCLQIALANAGIMF